MSRLVPFGWLTILAATFTFAFHFYFQHQERSKRDWPTATATIQSSVIVKTKQASLVVSQTSTSPDRDPRYKEDDVWALRVDYTFPVGGEIETGHTATSIEYAAPVNEGETTPSADMVAMANQLRAGSTATAHYDPTNSSESYLLYMESPADRSILISAWVLLGLGIALVVAPTLLK